MKVKIDEENFKNIEHIAKYLGKSGNTDLEDLLIHNLQIIENNYSDLEDLNNLLISAIMYYEELLQKVTQYQENIMKSLNTESNTSLYTEVMQFLDFKFDIDEQLKENL